MLLAAVAALAVGTVGIGTAGAALLPKPEGILLGTSAVEKVQYRPYCRRWRAECSRRWGWNTWRYRRCLTIRGCL
jgi:hypothetical protein